VARRRANRSAAGISLLRPSAAWRDADYIVVEIARHVLGESWMAEYVARANNGGIERVLV
jgi:glyoxylate carboligase